MAGVAIQDRKLAAKVRSLTLEKIMKVLNGEENDFQRQVLLKLAATVLPRINEHSGGEDENGKALPILFNVIGNVPSNNSNSENSEVIKTA